ncbi:uncharacterized protein LOC135705713 isoform X2 [Ochlerotatus camptorhynchus]|uniref:uncharacterized protein LOC135705713 isoform X2 n=1 Tax=Ochlerotatus camptorhynchus TaxID=644619 RepID=UPI0031D26E35
MVIRDTIDRSLEASGYSSPVVPIPASVSIVVLDLWLDMNQESSTLPLQASTINILTIHCLMPIKCSAILTMLVIDASVTPNPGNPERAVESPMEAPNPSVSVLPSAAFVHHSRSGPAVGCGEGVFQPTHYGECPMRLDDGQLLPDVSGISRESSRSIPCRKQDVVIFYQNAGGMNSDVEEYRLAGSDRCYDITVLCETWLDYRTPSSQVFGPDYEVFRCDRNPNNSRKSTGGGDLVAVRSGLEAKAIENDSWNYVEQVWTAINLGDRTLFLCALYIPPDRVRDNELIDTHCWSVFTVIESATPVDEVFIFGDFNLPGVSWSPSHSGFLYPDPDSSTFHAGAISLLDNYSAATLSRINHVVNENTRRAPSISSAPYALTKLVPHHPPLIVTVEDKLVRDFDDYPARHMSLTDTSRKELTTKCLTLPGRRESYVG